MNSYFRNFNKFNRFTFSGASKIKRGEIVNYEYRVKKMPDFTKILPGSHVRLKLRHARIPTKIKEIMYKITKIVLLKMITLISIR